MIHQESRGELAKIRTEEMADWAGSANNSSFHSANEF